MTGNGNRTTYNTYKNGDDWGMVFGIVLPITQNRFSTNGSIQKNIYKWMI